MEQLKLHVERIVRPIHAALARKNKMREELLGHLMEKAQGLMEQGSTADAACAEAIQQLGETSALRAELEASVPKLERLAYARLPFADVADAWFERPDAQSPAKFAFLRTLYTTIALVVELAVFITVQSVALIPALSHSKCPPWMLEIVAISTVAVGAAVTYVAYYGADRAGLVRMLSKTCPGGIWKKGAALVFFMFAYLSLFLPPVVLVALLSKPQSSNVMVAMCEGISSLKILTTIAVVVFLAIPSLGYAMKREHEQWAKWGRLEL